MPPPYSDKVGPLLDTHRTDIGTILQESLASEGQALALYKGAREAAVAQRQVTGM